MIFQMHFHRMIMLGVITAAAAWSGQSSSGTSAAEPGSIRWHAQRAQQQGTTSITIPAPRGMFEKISSLDQALSTYHVVVGMPIASVTQVLDNNHVYTWYKLRILESLVSHPNPEVPAVSIPEALLPVKANEIIVHVPQGTVTVDGVRITVTDPDSHLLTLHEKYLLFLSPDSSGQFAYLRAGPNSTFLIKPDNKIAPLVDTQSHMQVDVEASTGGSLDSTADVCQSKGCRTAPAAQLNTTKFHHSIPM